MKTIVINGFPLCSKHSGMHRFMIECLSRVDKQIGKKNFKVELVYPCFKRIHVPKFNNIKVKRIWSLSKDWYGNVLPNYLQKDGRIFCGMANDIPCGKRNIICLHDVLAVKPEAKFSEADVKERMEKFRMIAKKSEVIVTVSETSKREICELLEVSQDDVVVIYNSWEHMKMIHEDMSVFERHTDLKKQNYYYALGNVMPHKNFEWIAQVAKRNPNSTFVIAGDMHKLGNNSLFEADNLIYLGRVTDEENKALMSHCKAFLHPAFYEGFGIPPLEALSCGAPVIISNTSCLPEIYGKCAHYISPYQYDYDLDAILKEPVEPAENVLEKYSWDKSAQQWIDIFENCSIERNPSRNV